MGNMWVYGCTMGALCVRMYGGKRWMNSGGAMAFYTLMLRALGFFSFVAPAGVLFSFPRCCTNPWGPGQANIMSIIIPRVAREQWEKRRRIETGRKKRREGKRERRSQSDFVLQSSLAFSILVKPSVLRSAFGSVWVFFWLYISIWRV